MAIIAAIDAGTSAVKCVTWRADGGLETVGRVPVEVVRAAGGLSEMEVEPVWSATKRLLRTLFAQSRRRRERVGAIALTGQVNAALCIGRDGSPLGRAMLWEDRRASAEARELFGHGDANLRRALGVRLPPGTNWPAPKFAWLSRSREGGRRLAATWRVMQVRDFLFHRLTGEAWSDAVSWIGMADLRGARFDPWLLGWCGLAAEQMPTLRDPSASAALLPDLRRALGVATGEVLPRVVLGTADMSASFIGIDAKPGEGFILANTAEIAGFLTPRETGDAPRGVVRLPLPTSLGAIDVIYGSTTNGGATLEWAMKLLGTRDRKSLDAAAAAAAPGAGGLVFVPYIAGERAPVWDAKAAGVFVGLTLNHGPGHVWRAVLEGCAMSKRHVLETGCGGRPLRETLRRVIVTGGGARDALWNQIRAGVLGVKVEASDIVEASSAGVIRLAASALGKAAEIAPSERNVVRVDRAWVAAGEASYRRYRATAERLGVAGRMNVDG